MIIFENKNWKIVLGLDIGEYHIHKPGATSDKWVYWATAICRDGRFKCSKRVPYYIEKAIKEHFNPTPKYVVKLNGTEVGAHANPNFAIKIAKGVKGKGTLTISKGSEVTWAKEIDNE